MQESDFLDIEIFIRKNNISWTILFIFFANLFLTKKNEYLNLFIILFTYIFCAKYVFLIQILVYGVSFIVKKTLNLLIIFFSQSIFLLIIYLIIISNFTGYYFGIS